MNDPTNSPEPHDTADCFESQLRAIQPRAAKLDWNQILQPDDQAATSAAASVTPLLPTTGFSSWQMTSAVLASAIGGMIVGASVIFWLTTPLTNAQPQAQETQSQETQSIQPQPGALSSSQLAANPNNPLEQRPEQSWEQSWERPANRNSQPMNTRSQPANLDSHPFDWLDQDVLSVRSHSTLVPARLPLANQSTVVVRSTNTTSNSDPANQLSEEPFAATQIPERSITPTTASMLNRQQLLRQYLDEANQNIY